LFRASDAGARPDPARAGGTVLIPIPVPIAAQAQVINPVARQARKLALQFNV
jgi:hypothetical protein